MSIFKCSKCGVMENTAVSNYWSREKGSSPLCSQCDPEIGKWHGVFLRKPVPQGYVEGTDGFIYDPDDPYLKRIGMKKKPPS